jgi:hypothetical protein
MASKGFRIEAAPSWTDWQSDNLHNVRYDTLFAVKGYCRADETGDAFDRVLKEMARPKPTSSPSKDK